LKEDKKRFVILSIDIVGSTKMSQELSIEINSKIIQLYSQEISQLINYYNGYVLKFQGDGIIAYFPEPNYLGMNDNAILCAHSIKYFIINGLNKILNNNGFPSINFRIGLDSGEAMILIVGSKESKTHKDLIGLTINLATKIQGLAEPNKILAGEATITNAYYLYRTWFDKVVLPEDWNYYKNNKLEYQVFSSKF
jgi:adenylate cyclase